MKNKLLKCGFIEITEEKIPEYTGIEEDDLSSYESERVYEFGYVGYDNFAVIKLDHVAGDGIYRYKDGSNDFIIKLDNKLYLGTWTEGDYSIKDSTDLGYISNCTSNIDDFVKEMKEEGIDNFYCVSF